MRRAMSSAPTSGYIQIRVLGSFAVVRDGVTLEIGRWPRRTDSLLRLLACAPDHGRSREDVIALFWPDASPAAGSSNLRCTLHHLRRVLGRSDPPLLAADRTHVTLNAAYTWETDLARFEELARTAGGNIPLLVQAAAFYGGEPLPDDRYEEWAAPLRRRIQRTWRDVCMRLAHAYQERDEGNEAAEWLGRALENDPFDEEALQELIKVLLAIGQRIRALRAYRSFEARIRDELDIAPDPQTSHLVAELREEHDTAGLSTDGPSRHLRPVVASYPLSTAVPLVGRAVEVRQLEEIVRRDGGVRLVLLAAEAGIGKTRLLAEVARSGRGAGMLTLAGGCYEAEGRLAYGPLHDALLDYVATQSAALLRSQLDGLLPELSRVIPELHELVPGVAAPARATDGGQRLRLFSSIARMVERITVEQPLLLLIDDLQWADTETLQLLHYLLRQLTHSNIAIVGAYRQEDLRESTDLHRLTEMATDHRIFTLLLPPLDIENLAALLEERLGSVCSRQFVETLHRRSLGNPFFTLQMLRLMQHEGRLIQGATGWELVEGTAVHLPPEVRATIARRLRRLDQETSTALVQAAVLGREFSYASLEAMWEGDGEALLDALDRALDAHLIELTDIGFSFRHPLLHEVVYEQLRPARRAALHLRAGLALESIHTGKMQAAAEPAHHFLLGGANARALPYLIRAGEQSENAFAHEEAERYYRAALTLAEELGDGGRDGRLLVKLGDVLRITGRYDEALQTVERAVTLHRAANDLEAEASATALIGRIHFLRGTWEDGIERVLRMLVPLEASGPSAALGELYVALVPLYAPTGRYVEYLAAAERASDLGRSLADERVLAQAEMWRGLALAHLRRSDEARRALEAAVPRAESIGDLYSLGVALTFIGLSHILGGELEQARTYREQAVDAFQRLGDPGALAWGTSRLGDVYFLLGDWDHARACHEQAIELFRSIGGTSRHFPVPLVSLGGLALAQGHSDEASHLLDEGFALAVSNQHLGALSAAQHVLAEKALLEGDPEQALAHLQPHPLLQAQGSEDSIYTMPPPVLARTQLALGNAHDASVTVERGVERAASLGNRIERPEWLRIRGLVLSHQGRWDEAHAAFVESAALGRDTAYVYQEAHAHYELGRMNPERTLGGSVKQAEQDRERLEREAREELETALVMFRRLGARPFVERMERVLTGRTRRA